MSQPRLKRQILLWLGERAHKSDWVLLQVSEVLKIVDIARQSVYQETYARKLREKTKVKKEILMGNEVDKIRKHQQEDDQY